MSDKKKLRVALLAGGRSGEREVSLRGAAGIEKALDPQKYTVLRFDPVSDLVALAKVADSIDVAFILLHGVYGEDGTVQGYLELLDIPYQGSGVLGSALAMDKNLSKSLYRLHGLPVADWEVVVKDSPTPVSVLLENLRLPLVVKPVREGSSLGMTIARSAEELQQGIEKAFVHDPEVMVERFIEGREITVGVLGNHQPVALPLIEIIPGQEFEFFDYEAKYQPGATQEVCPAPVSAEVTAMAQAYAQKAHEVLKLRGYSRTDMMINDAGEIFLLETNTIPGMTETSLFPQAAAVHGLDFPQLLERLIELALENHNS